MRLKTHRLPPLGAAEQLPGGSVVMSDNSFTSLHAIVIATRRLQMSCYGHTHLADVPSCWRALQRLATNGCLVHRAGLQPHLTHRFNVARISAGIPPEGRAGLAVAAATGTGAGAAGVADAVMASGPAGAGTSELVVAVLASVTAGPAWSIVFLSWNSAWSLACSEKSINRETLQPTTPSNLHKRWTGA